MLTLPNKTTIKKPPTESHHFLNPPQLPMHVPFSKSQLMKKKTAEPKPTPSPRTQAMLTISPANFNNKITELLTKEKIISHNKKFKKAGQKPKKADAIMGPVRSMKNIRLRSQGDIGGSRDLVSERRVTVGGGGGGGERGRGGDGGGLRG
jgi:hypothetical protein